MAYKSISQIKKLQKEGAQKRRESRLIGIKGVSEFEKLEYDEGAILGRIRNVKEDLTKSEFYNNKLMRHKLAILEEQLLSIREKMKNFKTEENGDKNENTQV